MEKGGRGRGNCAPEWNVQSVMTMAWELRVWRHCAVDVMLVNMIDDVVMWFLATSRWDVRSCDRNCQQRHVQAA
jgi:hypothetical protein